MQLVEITLSTGAKTFINPIHVTHVMSGRDGETEIHFAQQTTAGHPFLMRTKDGLDATQARITNGLKNQ